MQAENCHDHVVMWNPRVRTFSSSTHILPSGRFLRSSVMLAYEVVLTISEPFTQSNEVKKVLPCWCCCPVSDLRPLASAEKGLTILPKAPSSTLALLSTMLRIKVLQLRFANRSLHVEISRQFLSTYRFTLIFSYLSVS